MNLNSKLSYTIAETHSQTHQKAPGRRAVQAVVIAQRQWEWKPSFLQQKHLLLRVRRNWCQRVKRGHKNV